MKANLATQPRGTTLLELLIVCALLTLLSVSTMQVLGDARVVRSRARARSTMLVHAQQHLDRLRLLPAGELKQGSLPLPSANGESAVARLEPRPDGTWEVEVTINHDAVEGITPVSLATIRPGGSP